MAMVRGLPEVVIWVHDVERSLRFYRDVLGLRVMSPPGMRGAIFLQVGDEQGRIPQQVVLVPLPAEAPRFPGQRTERTLHHFGVELVPGEFEREREGTYIDDPDGKEIELTVRSQTKPGLETPALGALRGSPGCVAVDLEKRQPVSRRTGAALQKERR